MNINERLKKLGVVLLTAVVVAAILFVTFKYALPIVLPFVVAWVVALVLQPIINFLSKKAKIPKWLSVIVLVLATLFLLSWAIYAIVVRSSTELLSLSKELLDAFENFSTDPNGIDAFIDKLNSLVPFFDFSGFLYNVWNNLDEYIASTLKNLVSLVSSSVVPLITKIVMAIPNAFVFFIITIISAVYISIDFKKINSFIAYQFPEKARDFLRMVKEQFVQTIGKYVRAYSLLILITFSELFVGFSILGVHYSFIIALITALVDILPVLGTGTILIPWGVYMLISGNYFMGVGILILYVIITVVRQILEPKIVGSYVGLYPLVTLMAMYIGTKVMGFFGLFLFPIAIILLKKMNDDGHIRLWKVPPEIADAPEKKTSVERIREKLKARKEKKNNDPKSSSDGDNKEA
ncbi:MAG: sporulation integral membrane protein YtvI [Clostridia bacterium]|nr:sporulation integral membrane protein YtvI [Clostridia bacterium]